MLDATPAANAARNKLVDAFRNPDPYRIDELEVIFASDVLALEGSLVPPYIHLARFEGLTDETTARMTEICVADARSDVAEQGSEGVVIGTGRESGTLAAISFWESMRDMRAVRRQYTESVPGVALPYTDNFELVAARNLNRLPSTESRSPA